MLGLLVAGALTVLQMFKRVVEQIGRVFVLKFLFFSILCYNCMWPVLCVRL